MAGAAEAEVEQRKVVTVLFADITGSTQLGEQLDPEVVRSLLARHFAQARSILERHGGTVEKFIGDAVMAVFGVPTAHEDDAFRAVRAAIEMQAGVERINSESSATARLQIRIGINTGEVVAGPGTGETLVTGDTVNTAARLEQSAQPGEVLLGPATYALVRSVIQAGPARDVVAKGKTSPISAVPVQGLRPDQARPVSETPLAGRDTEIETLRRMWEDRSSAGPQLVTLVAAAGVGKSRLARELMSAVAPEALVAKGRCLPYGDGITYWPIREIVHQVAGIAESDSPEAARVKIERLVGPEASVADGVAIAIGLSSDSVRQEELFWAIRRSFEGVVETRPLLLVVEDLHWAEETMLDLLGYMVDVTSAPLLIVATARPELLDSRAGWGTGAHETVIRLRPLDASASEGLLLRHSGAEGLSDGARSRILAIAEGNPLYLEEITAMLQERLAGAGTAEGEEMEIPPSIQALLTARLDQLSGLERSVLQRGSVIGRSFEAAAIAALGSPEGDRDLGRSLVSLVRKELLLPDRGELTAGDAFRFRHIMVRDAAYQTLSKSDRAVLHERFADWLEHAAGDRVLEFEEILAHHLEQSARNRRSLGHAEVGSLERRASSRFLSAGRRALHRDDSTAAISLLTRAAALGHLDPEIELQAQLALADVFEGQAAFPEGQQAAERAVALATGIGDERSAALARIFQLYIHRHTRPGTWAADARDLVPDAVEIFTRHADDLGLAHAWVALGLAAWTEPSVAGEASDRALAHARAARDPRTLGVAISQAVTQMLNGPTPVSGALPKAISLADEAAGVGRLFSAEVQIDVAVLEAMAGRYDDAVSHAEQAMQVHRDLGQRLDLAFDASRMALIHEYGGHPEAAEAALREPIEMFEGTDERAVTPYLRAQLARSLTAQGRYEEAREQLERANVDDDNPTRENLCATCWSRIHVAEGDFDAAVAAAERALSLISPDSSGRYALTLIDLGLALAAAGRTDDAGDAFRRANATAEHKGIVALMELIDRARSGPLTAGRSSSRPRIGDPPGAAAPDDAP